MSVDATRWAWSISSVSATQKIVLLTLADRADENHRAWPSIARLEMDTCLDRKTVMRAIDDLEKIGFLITERGNGSGNKYWLTGVSDRHETSTKIGTSTKTGTGPKNGTAPVPKLGPLPVPKLGHESKREPTKNLTSGFVIPDWINQDAWLGFVASRKKLKKPLTDHAIGLLVVKLERFRANGYDPNAILDNSTMNGWQGVFEPKQQSQQVGEGVKKAAGCCVCGNPASKEIGRDWYCTKHDQYS